MDGLLPLDERLKPIITDATTKALGIRVDELTTDISSKLAKTPFLDFPIDTSIKFKIAKKLFKKQYLLKMLEVHQGNISEVAKEAGVDRRSIHRLIDQLHISVGKVKEDLLKPYDFRLTAVNNAITDVLDKYKHIFHPEKLQKMYKNVNQLSEGVLKELPEQPLTLQDAEEDFERKYLKKALEEHNHNITQTARKIGLRYETLQRKTKQLLI